MPKFQGTERDAKFEQIPQMQFDTKRTKSAPAVAGIYQSETSPTENIAPALNSAPNTGAFVSQCAHAPQPMGVTLPALNTTMNPMQIFMPGVSNAPSWSPNQSWSPAFGNMPTNMVVVSPTSPMGCFSPQTAQMGFPSPMMMSMPMSLPMSTPMTMPMTMPPQITSPMQSPPMSLPMSSPMSFGMPPLGQNVMTPCMSPVAAVSGAPGPKNSPSHATRKLDFLPCKKEAAMKKVANKKAVTKEVPTNIKNPGPMRPNSKKRVVEQKTRDAFAQKAFARSRALKESITEAKKETTADDGNLSDGGATANAKPETKKSKNIRGEVSAATVGYWKQRLLQTTKRHIDNGGKKPYDVKKIWRPVFQSARDKSQLSAYNMAKKVCQNCMFKKLTIVQHTHQECQAENNSCHLLCNKCMQGAHWLTDCPERN